MSSLTLKERLEEVWKLNGCCSPCHINIWSELPVGYLKFAHLNLYWCHGKLLAPKGKKPKGKGFSFLHKFYGVALRCRITNEKKKTTQAT